MDITETPAPVVTGVKFDRETCWKCSGTGRIPEYGHRHNGLCYACEGQGAKLTPAAKKIIKIVSAVLEERLVTTLGEIEVGQPCFTDALGHGRRTLVRTEPSRSSQIRVDPVTGERVVIPFTSYVFQKITFQSTPDHRVYRAATPADYAVVVDALGRRKAGYTLITA